MTYSLDAATSLTSLGDGLYHREPSEAYYNVKSMFGGWVLAVAVEAVNGHAKRRGELVSINANFAEGLQLADVYVKATLLRARARTDFWRVEFRAAEDLDAEVMCSVEMVWTQRRDSEMDYSVTFPDVASPEGLPVFDTSNFPPWFTRYEQRMVEGTPLTVNEEPRSVIWVRDQDRRPLDIKGLTALSDVFAPRSMFLGPEPKLGSTVTYSLYVYASAEELAAVDSRPLLLEGGSGAVRQSCYDQRGLIWTPSGRLLAVTNQMGFYR